jgi:hydroxyacyl-ACP dehydratase HTD2-like protein with hotdog domain
MHDTADLNKARQVLLVLPKLAATASVTSSARELFEKNTTEDALALSHGGPMPLGSELVLFNPLLSEATLGSDGTERTFGPPGGLDQRMWASGSFEFEQGRDLKIGQEVRCEVAVESVKPKQGTKTGLMVLVTRKLVYSSPEGVVMTERRCHVYRKQRPAEQRRYVPPSADAAPKAEEGRLIQCQERACRSWQSSEPALTPSTSPSRLTVEEKQSDFGFDYYATRAALFRYSAVTFNAHRIHLDPEYCRNEEGHPGALSLSDLL